MNYEALLKLSRDNADEKMSLKFGLTDPCYRELERNALVVQMFLERICPIVVPEAYRHAPEAPARPAARQEELLLSQAASLLRDYEGDAHPEDVQDVTRWLSVYDARYPSTTGEKHD